MDVNFVAEATAVIRRTGAWSVYLGPRGILTRFYQRDHDFHALERRLGVLATCVGKLLVEALEDSGHPSQVMLVALGSSQESTARAGRGGAFGLVARIAVECEADCGDAQSCWDRCVRRDPLFLLLTREFRSVQMTVETRSMIQMWIC